MTEGLIIISVIAVILVMLVAIFAPVVTNVAINVRETQNTLAPPETTEEEVEETAEISSVTASSVGPPIMNFSETSSTDLREFYWNGQERGYEVIVNDQSLLDGQPVTNVTAKLEKTSNEQSGAVVAAVFNNTELTPDWLYIDTVAMPTDATGPKPTYFQGVGATVVTVCNSGCDFSNLQLAIDSIPQPEGGTVQITGAISSSVQNNLTSNLVIEFTGSGSLQSATNPSRPQFNATDVSNIKIIDAVMTATQSGIQSIYLSNVTNADISVANINLVKGSNSAPVWHRDVHNVTIYGKEDGTRGIMTDASRCIFGGSSSDFQADGTTTNVWVENIYCHDTSIEGIRPNSINDLVVRNNIVNVTGDNLFDIGGSLNAVFRDNIAHCDTAITCDTGLHMDKTTSALVVNNTFVEIDGPALTFCSTTDTRATHNIMSSDNDVAFVITTGCTFSNDDNIIENNLILGSKGSGVFISSNQNDELIQNNDWCGFGGSKNMFSIGSPNPGVITSGNRNVCHPSDSHLNDPPFFLYPNSATTPRTFFADFVNGTAGRNVTDGTFDTNNAELSVRGDAKLTIHGNLTASIVGDGGTNSGYVYVYDAAQAEDWLNTETTVYIKKRPTTPTNTDLLIGSRSNSNNANATYPDPLSCNDNGYTTSVGLDGVVSFQKRIVNDTNGYTTLNPQPNLDLGDIPDDTWVGFKFVVENEGETTTHPKVEVWRDTSNATLGGSWEKLMEYYDIAWTNENLPDVSSVCGYEEDQSFITPGIASFLNAVDVTDGSIDLKWFSVREIDSPASTKHVFWQKDLADISTTAGTISASEIADGTWTLGVGDRIGIIYSASNATLPLNVYTVDGADATLPENYAFDGGNTLSDFADSNDDHYALTVHATTRPASNVIDDSTATYWQNLNIQGSNEFIYADLGESKTVSQVRLVKQHIDYIPETINIYVTDNAGAFGSPVLSAHTLTQGVGSETINIADTDGRYVVIEPETWDTAQSMRISEFNVEVITTVTVEVESERDAWDRAVDGLMDTYFIAMMFIIIAIVVFVFAFILKGRLDM